MTPVQGMSAREDAMEEKMKIPAQKNNDAISDRRRKLLKAALATAPVIATLPNGSVFANTSIQQCIPCDKKRQPHGQLSKTPRYQPSDQWQEVAVVKRVYQKNNSKGTKTIYEYGGDFFEEDRDGYLRSTTLDFLRQKNRRNGNLKWDSTPIEETNAYALLYYEPNSKKTGVYGPSLKKGGKHGWTALTGTCLTSLKKVV
ncbi:MAG: hypothetical protein GY934_19340 [Gammaproteobacteria bacterium]|nr:hypothetical protein [Gammaproteobacteria bacterium]